MSYHQSYHQKTNLYTSTLATPLGYMQAVCDDEGILYLNWQQDKPIDNDYDNDVSRETCVQLKDYLSGKRQVFTIPVSDKSVSQAMRRWLDVMQKIPYGQTISYRAFAAMWGNPKAARAAGGACQKNPLPIIFPCHRVIGGNGTYDRYSGGDHSTPDSPANIARKKALLDLEAGLHVIL